MISQYRQQRFIYRIFFTILFAFLSVVFLTAGVQSENNEQIKWQIPAEGMVINKEAYKAIAITNEEGTPVTSAADGVVRYAAYTSENGYRIEIDHGQGWVTTYSHLQSIDVEVQQRVSSGEKIAAMGSTGQSTGVHLKFEVVHEDKLIDPQSILTFVLSDDHEPIFPLQFPVAEPFQLLTTYGINAGKNSANEFHPGIDIAAENESPIQAAAGGIVKIAQYDPNYGNHVIIDHGLGWISTYSHLDELAVQEQSIVQKGSILGTMGSTGKTTGVHLHFEMHRGDKPVDPMSYFLHTDNDVRGLTWEELQTVLYP